MFLKHKKARKLIWCLVQEVRLEPTRLGFEKPNLTPLPLSPNSIFEELR